MSESIIKIQIINVIIALIGVATGIIFILLKNCNIIKWDLVWVLSPFWIVILLEIMFWILCFVAWLILFYIL